MNPWLLAYRKKIFFFRTPENKYSKIKAVLWIRIRSDPELNA